MSDTVYCYHCRAQHPRTEMRLIVSKTGKRWRCINSIKAAARSAKDITLRDAYGKKVSEDNKEVASLRQHIRNAIEKTTPRCPE